MFIVSEEIGGMNKGMFDFIKLIPVFAADGYIGI
jgi:hypothetical protein